MGHGMTSDDSFQSYLHQAWHRLGTVFVEKRNPREAAKEGNLLWTVDQKPLEVQMPDGDYVTVPGHYANVRSDTNRVLGIVKSRFVNLQPSTFIDVICSLAEDENDLEVQTMGTYGGGEVMFASILLDSFGVGINKEDENKIYANFVNAYNGRYKYHAFPSGIRMVCANTVRFAVQAAGRALSGRKQRADADGVAFKHTKNLEVKVEEARDAILGFKNRGKEYAEQAAALANVGMDSKKLVEYFAQVYSAHFGRFVVNATTKEEERLQTRQNNILGDWLINYNEDPNQQIAGIQGTLWAAMNSITQWADHQKTVRIHGEKKPEERDEHRKMSNLFGDSNRIKKDAMAFALAAL